MTITDKAAAVLLDGGVIAYPTEGVFGLGCLPDRPKAVERLLAIKQRDPSKGLILIAANAGQLAGWIRLPEGVEFPTLDTTRPTTWIVPTGDRVNTLVRGDNVGVAVRITSNPVAAAICIAVESPIVSTSANLSGQPVAEDQLSLRRQFRTLVDYVVPGDCGPASGPSEIRHLLTGAVIRPR